MTFDDLAGQEFVHPEHGRLTIIEHNHAGQVFCYDTRGLYYIVEGDHPALADLEDEEVPDHVIEFVEFGEELLSDPDTIGFIVMLHPGGLVEAKFKCNPDEAKEAICNLYDAFSEPYEKRFIAN